MSKRSGHYIIEYNATDDIVTCVCGFVGTANGFNVHKKNGRNSGGTLDFLGRLPAARFDYHKQGSLIGLGKKYGR